MTKDIAKLKTEYLHYYRDVPVQRYAAAAIGRDEDTILRWRKDDAEFAESVEGALANWVKEKVMATKPEFALERLQNSVFGSRAALAIEHKVDIVPDNELKNAFAEFLKEKTR